MKSKSNKTELFDPKTMELMKEVFQKLGMKPDEIPDVSKVPERHKSALMAVYYLFLAIEAENDGWEADPSNHTQTKYWPWPWVNSAGSGFDFSRSGYGYDRSYSTVGARLSMKDSKTTMMVFEKYNELYRKFMLRK